MMQIRFGDAITAARLPYEGQSIASRDAVAYMLRNAKDKADSLQLRGEVKQTYVYTFDTGLQEALSNALQPESTDKQPELIGIILTDQDADELITLEKQMQSSRLQAEANTLHIDGKAVQELPTRQSNAFRELSAQLMNDLQTRKRHLEMLGYLKTIVSGKRIIQVSIAD